MGEEGQVKQECIPVGCVPSAAVAVCWGVCPGGCLPRGNTWGMSAQGVSAWGGVCRAGWLLGDVCWEGGCLLGGVCPGGCLPRGCVSQHAPLADTPPVERMTDRCKNITFPQLRLRTVINFSGTLVFSANWLVLSFTWIFSLNLLL